MTASTGALGLVGTSSLIKAAAERINLLNLDCTALQVNFNLNCNLYAIVLFLEKMQIQKKKMKKTSERIAYGKLLHYN